MNCPNPNCKATGLPDDARFCPDCGTEIIKPIKVIKCEFSEDTNGGKSVSILWDAKNISYVEIDGRRVGSKHFESNIRNSHVYHIEFFAKDGYSNIVELSIWYEIYSGNYYTSKEEYEYVHNEEYKKKEEKEQTINIMVGMIFLLVSIAAAIFGMIYWNGDIKWWVIVIWAFILLCGWEMFYDNGINKKV